MLLHLVLEHGHVLDGEREAELLPVEVACARLDLHAQLEQLNELRDARMRFQAQVARRIYPDLLLLVEDLRINIVHLARVLELSRDKLVEVSLPEVSIRPKFDQSCLFSKTDPKVVLLITVLAVGCLELGQKALIRQSRGILRSWRLQVQHEHDFLHASIDQSLCAVALLFLIISKKLLHESVRHNHEPIEQVA